MSSPLSERSDPSTTLLRPQSQSPRADQRGEVAADPISDRVAIHYNTTLSLAAANPNDGVKNAFFLNQLLAVCGGANAADAVEILAVSFILPAAQDDLHLSGAEKGWLAGVIFVGMMLGGWCWGALSDRYGRRNCLMWCLIINGVGGLLSAISPTFLLMLLCRFISGIGVGGSVPVVFTYFSEFLSTRDRGPYMVGIACCWMVGSLFTAGLAWIVIPRRSLELRLFGMVMHSWRLFAFLCGLPSLACAVALSFCPESPRWLLSRGRMLEAKQVLVAMYEVNHRAAMLRSELGMGLGLDSGASVPLPVPADIDHAAHDLRVQELRSGRWANALCGACCFRGRVRRRGAHARPFLVALSLAELEAGDPALALAAHHRPHGADAHEAANLLGSHGRSDGALDTNSGAGGAYSKVAASSSSPPTSASASAFDQPAGSGASVPVGATMHSPSSAATTTATAAASSADGAASAHFPSPSPPLSSAFGPDFYSTCSEPERWAMFTRQLARLDATPVSQSPQAPGPSSSASQSPESLSDSQAYDPEALHHHHQQQGEHESVALASSAIHGSSDDHDHGSERVVAPSPLCSRFALALQAGWSECAHALGKTRSLFASSTSRALTLKLASTWFFLAFGVYGLSMWMPQYFADQDAAAAAEAEGSGGSGGSGEDVTSDSMYLTAVVGAVSALPANLVSLHTVKAYGRIRTLVVALLLSSLCVALVPVLHTRSASVVMLTIFSGVNTACWNALNITTTEVYRTEVRATAFGFCAALGRVGAILGNVMFGELMDGSSQVMPLFLTAAALLLSAISGAMLPETKNLNLA